MVAIRCISHCLIAGILTAWLSPFPALADSGHEHAGKIGKPGTKAQASRTVTITLREMLYEPESIQVKKGETIRFVLKNAGSLLHEFNIGTAEMHAEHQKEMAMMVDHGMLTPTGINHQMMKMDHSKMGMPEMRHDDPNAVLVEPGKSAELVWTFSRATTLEFACNLPGH
ncbi:MAG: cupredoxin domain-containing protein [Geminicoccales bacterium]